MKITLVKSALVGLLVVIGWGSAVSAQAPAPATLWSFLGIPQAFKAVGNTVLNHCGNLPFLEPKPPLKPLAAAENLKSPVEAIKVAAEVKQAEDLAPQKIKAIKYLAKIGCGCYDKDGKITEALLAAMDDCTEEVRLATVRAVARGARGEMCENCKQRSCCSKEMTEKLAKIAYERDDDGCWIEPSERVREAAIRALDICCPSMDYIEEGPTPAREGPEDRQRESPFEDDAVPPTPLPDAEAGSPTPLPTDSTTAGLDADAALKMMFSSAPGPVRLPSSVLTEAGYARSSPTGRTSTRRTATVPRRGTVDYVDLAGGVAQISIENDGRLHPGARLKIYHKYVLTGSTAVGEMEVVESAPGSATARPVGPANLAKVARGDLVVILYDGC